MKNDKTVVIEILNDVIDFSGYIDGIIDNLIKLKVKYPNHLLRIEHYQPYDDSEILLIGEREENYKESQVRIKKEEAAKKANKSRAKKKHERELALYEKLNKKYGKTIIS